MNLIIDKYEKYNIRYNSFSNKIIIESKIPVSEFIKLKMELKAINYKFADIEVRDEN